MNLFITPVTQLLTLLRSGRLTALELMEATFDRIEQANPKVNALVQQLPKDEALRQARAADQQKVRGPLHGLPVTVKDGTKVRGFRCSLGCKGSYLQVAQEDAVAVQRLRAAGAIVIGQTNVPELMCAFETDNLLYGRTNNPYDFSRVAGGSSGGEAAAIATGCSFLGLGGDAGGSIRIPAHCCGIAGLKPSLGLVPMKGRIPEDAMGLSCQIAVFGTMGRSIDECELAFSLIAGPHPRDPYALPVAIGSSDQVDLAKLRVGFYSEVSYAAPSVETTKLVEEVAELLSGAGAQVEPVQFDCLAGAYQLIYDAFFIPAAGSLRTGLAALGVKEIHPLLEHYLQRTAGQQRSGAEVAKFHRDLGAFRSEMARLMEPYDLLICPVMGEPAVAHGNSWAGEYNGSYSAPYNLTGWPAATVRCGTSATGLPMNLQFVAKRWCDGVAIAAARFAERALGGYQPPSWL